MIMTNNERRRVLVENRKLNRKALEAVEHAFIEPLAESCGVTAADYMERTISPQIDLLYDALGMVNKTVDDIQDEFGIYDMESTSDKAGAAAYCEYCADVISELMAEVVTTRQSAGQAAPDIATTKAVARAVTYYIENVRQIAFVHAHSASVCNSEIHQLIFNRLIANNVENHDGKLHRYVRCILPRAKNLTDEDVDAAIRRALNDLDELDNGAITPRIQSASGSVWE